MEPIGNEGEALTGALIGAGCVALLLVCALVQLVLLLRAL